MMMIASHQARRARLKTQSLTSDEALVNLFNAESPYFSCRPIHIVKFSHSMVTSWSIMVARVRANEVGVTAKIQL